VNDDKNSSQVVKVERCHPSGMVFGENSNDVECDQLEHNQQAIQVVRVALAVGVIRGSIPDHWDCGVFGISGSLARSGRC